MKKFFSNDFYVGILCIVVSILSVGFSFAIVVPFASGYGYFRSKKAFKSGKKLALITTILNGILFVFFLFAILGMMVMAQKLKVCTPLTLWFCPTGLKY